ncbi:MAG: hypothetical protein IPH75_04635 [bacterium]|nr:hypothetical protein [bacterium]
MPRIICIIALLVMAASAHGQRAQRLDLDHADLLEVLLGVSQDTTIAVGSVFFRTESGTISCDSATWIRGKKAILRGSVMVEDTIYRLLADSIDYDLLTNQAFARGPYVELWSRTDSLFATGTNAFYDRNKKYFRMEKRPTVYLNYPDSAEMVQIDANQVEFFADSSLAIALGEVIISSKDIKATAGRAVMQQKLGILDLYEQPVLVRGQSTVKGSFISVLSEQDLLRRIDVTDSARAEFKEVVDTLPDSTVLIDQSILTGRRIYFDFKYGVLDRVTSIGQAYSWYYPAKKGGDESSENAVSGDTIQFAVANEQLQSVTVLGGAIGNYINTKNKNVDSTVITVQDTIDYSSSFIRYEMADSVITLLGQSHIESGTVELDAHQVLFDTRDRLIKAYSADIVCDSFPDDSTLTARYQPNPIPVILKDKQEELYGDYLEYSIDTEKGKIVQSKSKYETGFYYGERVYRAQENIFYVEDGRYTTCDADEPHFHFYSKNMKFIEDDKLIARPVVLNIGRLPILALPYYVFPLKKGRHSGILPFTFGNIEQGDRYIQNVGYYWAASEHYDLQGAMSYHESRSAFTFSGQFRYKTLYVYDGYLRGNYTKETSYDSRLASETKSTKYDIYAAHNHDFSPTFRVSSIGQYVSDKTYYADYSTDLDTRLNNKIYGKFSFTKKLNKSMTLSGGFSHDETPQTQRRVDKTENVGLTLPVISPFGSGELDADGQLQSRWYHNLRITPRTSFAFFSSRTRLVDTVVVDTNDTTQDVTRDTTYYFMRKKYATQDYSFGANLPLTFARFIRFNPAISYRENWQYLYETDTTRQLGLEPSFYRTYSYSAGVTAGTDIYGTVYPNMLGLLGVRQVLSPSVSYTYVPKADLHREVRNFTGVGTGTVATAQNLTFSMRQLYQAKIKKGDGELALELLSLYSEFSYDLEKDSFNLSDLTTSFQSNVIPRITLNGNLRHSFYRPGTSEVRFWSPYLEQFSLQAGIRIAGSRFLFDDVADQPASPPDSMGPAGATAPTVPQSSRARGWETRLSYSYSESGRDKAFVKSSFLQLALDFNLTPTTSVSYSQYYDIGRQLTIRNSIGFRKTLHCWTGEFNWVPIGSGRGYSFRLFVTAIPAIKVDNSSTASAGTFLNQ